METLGLLIGKGKDLTVLHMGIRTVIVFLLAYLLIRISGRRSFVLKSPLDNVIVILLGAILSRAVVGASPFVPVIVSCLIIVLIHRLSAWASTKWPVLSEQFSARRLKLYSGGKFIESSLKIATVSREEIFVHIREVLHSEDLEQIEKIFMEPNGRITLIVRAKK